MINTVNFSPVSSSPSVISGQQVGLLGGQIFILYKILGVFHLTGSSDLSTLSKLEGLVPEDTPLQPVFWLEGNDADLDEIAAFYGLDDKGNMKKYIWRPQQLRGQPIGNYLIDDDLLRLYNDFFSALPPTSHTDMVRDLVYQSYRLGDTLLSSNYKFFTSLFKGWEESLPGFKTRKKMIWFRSDDERFRNYSQNLLREEILSTPEGEQCPVFALFKGRREALLKKAGYQTRNGRKIDPQDPLVTLLPSLWNRSLLQDAYWRGAAYVAGPGEEKYLGELLPRYHHYGLTPARVIPRMSATVSDLAWDEAADRLGFTPEEITSKNKNELVSLLQSKDPILQADLPSLRKKLQINKEKEMQRFKENPSKFDGSDITFKIYEKRRYVEMKHTLGKARREFKNRRAEDLDSLKSLLNWLHPNPKSGRHFPQERLHNIVTFLNRYGTGVINDIYRDYRFEKKFLRLPIDD